MMSKGAEADCEQEDCETRLDRHFATLNEELHLDAITGHHGSPFQKKYQIQEPKSPQALEFCGLERQVRFLAYAFIRFGVLVPELVFLQNDVHGLDIPLDTRPAAEFPIVGTDDEVYGSDVSVVESFDGRFGQSRVTRMTFGGMLRNETLT